MGLFGRFRRRVASEASGDDVLLLHAMLLMSSADGTLEGSEIATLEHFVNTLPEFKHANFDAQMIAARKLRARYGSATEAVAALAGIGSEAVRKKAFVLAADIAMASGDVDDAEEALLEVMQHALGIDDELAARTIEILALKYAR